MAELTKFVSFDRFEIKIFENLYKILINSLNELLSLLS